MNIHEEAQEAAKLAYPDDMVSNPTILEVLRDAYYRGYKDRARKAEQARAIKFFSEQEEA